MSIVLPQLNVATDNFGTMITRVNSLASALASNTITVDTTTGGSLTIGNAQLQGNLTATGIYVQTSLSGGNTTVAANLTVTSNVLIQSSVPLANTTTANAINLTLQTNVSSVNTALQFFEDRIIPGTGWQTAQTVIQRTVTGNGHAFIAFGGNTAGEANSYGIALGTNNTVGLYLTNNNAVTILNTLTVNGAVTFHSNIISNGSFSTAGIITGAVNSTSLNTGNITAVNTGVAGVLTVANNLLVNTTNFVVNSSATFNANLNITNLTVANTLTVSNTISSLTLTTNSTVTSISSLSYFSNAVTFNGNITFNGSVNGNPNFPYFLGEMKAVAFNSAPAKWQFCYGQSLPTTGAYAALYGSIGNAFGGNTTFFNLPDMRGRVAVGGDAMGGTAAGRLTVGIAGFDGTILGNSGGNQNLHQHLHSISDPGHYHAISDPAHNHYVNDPGHSHSYYDPTHSHQVFAQSGPQGSVGASSGLNYVAITISSNSGGPIWTTGVATGIGIASAGTGIWNSASGTGIGIYGNYTGITATTNSGAGGSQNVQPSLVVNWIIFCGA